MSMLSIRNLPPQVHARLRVRAARAGRSMEAEARAILEAACRVDDETGPAEDPRDWVDRIYAQGKPRGVVDDLLAERRREAASE